MKKYIGIFWMITLFVMSFVAAPLLVVGFMYADIKGNSRKEKYDLANKNILTKPFMYVHKKFCESCNLVQQW